MSRVLIVDDDPDDLQQTAAIAAGLGFTVVTAASGDAALAQLRADPQLAAVLVDLVMPDTDGMALLATLARERLAVPAIVLAASPSPALVATILRAGAVDYVDKPVAPARLLAALDQARRRVVLETALRTSHPETSVEVVTSSPAMARVVAVCRKAARSPLPLLLEGEPGTGKTRLARLVHASGDRSGRPFIAVDCAMAPPDRIDSLLFGAAGGLLAARGGTLLLEEIAELPITAQRQLLRVLETGELRQPGATRAERLNLRLIATSSRRLLDLARSGDVDAGLHNHLNVLPLYLPPLRQRREDLPALAEHFITIAAAESGARVDAISPAALALLAAYDWPGNVRQFAAMLFRAVSLAAGPTLEPTDFPQLAMTLQGRDAAVAAVPDLNTSSAPVHLDRAISRAKQTEASGSVPDRFLTRNGDVTPLADLERELIVFALGKLGGRMSRIARALGIGRSTLYRKLRDYGLDGEVESDAA